MKEIWHYACEISYGFWRKKNQHFHHTGNSENLKYSSFADTRLGSFCLELAFQMPEFHIFKNPVFWLVIAFSQNGFTL